MPGTLTEAQFANYLCEQVQHGRYPGGKGCPARTEHLQAAEKIIRMYGDETDAPAPKAKSKAPAKAAAEEPAKA